MSARDRLKRWLLKRNSKGNLLWVRPVALSFTGPWRWKASALLSALRYLCHVFLMGERPLAADWDAKATVFYLLERVTAGKRVVVKLPRLDNGRSQRFRRAIKAGSSAAFEAKLRELATDPWLGAHLPDLYCVKRDGAYESEFVEGTVLSSLWRELNSVGIVPRGLPTDTLVAAIERLLLDLQHHHERNTGRVGDWALHNLVFERSTGIVKNVDLEGLFVSIDGDSEARYTFIESELLSLRNLLELAHADCPESRQVLNTLRAVSYTQGSGSAYSGMAFLAGYHSLTLRGRFFRGQRDCESRFAGVPFDFQGASVLDLGCNCGGMLHWLAPRIRCGVGVDHDFRCVNAAGTISALESTSNLRFICFDLDDDNLFRLDDYLLGRRFDICMLLSVCLWLKNWRRVIGYASTKADALLFESNGTREQQGAQVSYLRENYRHVQEIRARSVDDPAQKSRALYLCHTPLLTSPSTPGRETATEERTGKDFKALACQR